MMRRKAYKGLAVILMVALLVSFSPLSLPDWADALAPAVLAAPAAVEGAKALLVGIAAAGTAAALANQQSYIARTDIAISVPSPPMLPGAPNPDDLYKIIMEQLMSELQDQMDKEIDRRIKNGEVPEEVRALTKSVLILQFQRGSLQGLNDIFAGSNIYELPPMELYQMWDSINGVCTGLDAYFENLYTVTDVTARMRQNRDVGPYLIRPYDNSHLVPQAINEIRERRQEFRRNLKEIENRIMTERAEESLAVHITSVDSSYLPCVTAYVTVTDGLNRSIRGLDQKQNFRVFDNGMDCDFTVERIDSSHIKTTTNIALVVDASTSMSGSPIAQAKQGAGEFAARMRPEDRLFLSAFGGTVTRLDVGDPAAGAETPPDGPDGTTASREAYVRDTVVSRLDGVGLDSSTALYDALYAAIEDIGQPNTRRIVVVLSDGADNSSARSIYDVRQLAVETGTTIFAIALGSASEHANLQELAMYTGGGCYFSPDANSLSAIYDRIADIVSVQYKLNYIAPLKAYGPNRGNLRTLQVTAYHYEFKATGAVEYTAAMRETTDAE